MGTGIISTAIKAELAGQPLTDRVTRAMATLNRDAAMVIKEPWGPDLHISHCQ